MAVPLWSKLLLVASVVGNVSSLTPPSTEDRGEEGHGSHGEHNTAVSACRAAQMAAAGWADAFVPSCTDAGLFERRQCHMFVQQCWCVDPATGTEMDNTRRKFDEGVLDCDKYVSEHTGATERVTPHPTPTSLPTTVVPPSADRPVGPCHVELLRTRPLLGAYVPQCTEDGKYKQRQCHGSTGYCWCVSDDGVEVEGTRRGPSEDPVNCEDASKPIGPCHLMLSRTIRSRPLLGAYVPQCTDDGKYQQRQCHGGTGYCWCVSDDGVEVEGTRRGPSEGPVDCEKADPTQKDEDGSATPTPTPTALPPSVSTPAGRRSAIVTYRFCSLPPDAGSSCSKWSSTRWYFDRETATCKTFQYGGCEGNDNNFDSKIECEFACPPSGCSATDCKRSCDFGYQHDANNCRLCRCDDDPCSKVDCWPGQSCKPYKHSCYDGECEWGVACYDDPRNVPSYCALPAEVGPCSKNTSRWYFSTDEDMMGCIMFTYGGCGGNKNNFKDQFHCIRTCKEPCDVDMCSKIGQFGYDKRADGCDTCAAVSSPCWDVKCPTGETCVARKVCNPSPCKVVAQCSKVESTGRKIDEACTRNPDSEYGGAQYPRWYYSTETRECRLFYFRHPHYRSRKNNFDTKEDCERTCVPHVCKPVTCRMECPFGFARDNNGCEVCQCADPCKVVECPEGERCQPELAYCATPPCAAVARCMIVRSELPNLCSLGFNAGRCSARVQKWFYNVTSNECKLRNFSNCRGNPNRFNDRRQCESTCKPTTCRPSACAKICPFGLAKDDNGCDVCECFSPCKDVTCKRGEMCLPEQESCEKSPCPFVGKCFGSTDSDQEARCTLQVEVGTCSSRRSRWFFNATSNQCEAFVYSGCHGNDNRFDTRSACKEACERHRCEPVRCRMLCPFGWAKDENGCDICRCINPCKKVTCLENETCLPERRSCLTSPCPVMGKCFAKRPHLASQCLVALDVGMCHSRERKWFFNLTSNACEAFNYTGCRGNYNRFNSMTECRQTCEPRRCEPVRCEDTCPFDSVKDENGCDTCQCINPCKDVKCAEGEHCVPERVQCIRSPCPAIGTCYANQPEVKCEPVRCRMFCPFGWAKDENGCDICKCVNPCKDIHCVDNERCLPERQYCNKSPCPVVGRCFAKRPDLEPHCSLALEVGLCNLREQKWFFNVTSSKCEAFNYTGCRGNGNRFNSKTECRQTCEPQRCEPVRCEETCPFGSVKDDNGCDTCQCIDPCEDVKCAEGEHCVPERVHCIRSPCPAIGTCYAHRPDVKCEPVGCRMFCPFGWAKDEDGCDICKCVNPCKDVNCADNERCLPERQYCNKSPCPVVGRCFAKRPDLEPLCSLALEVGLCHSRERKWFFNVTSNKCEAFNYTGCRGNGNRFESEAACQKMCTANACGPPCQKFCPYGFVKGDDGCDICQCINPCVGISCSDDKRCFPERLRCNSTAPCPVTGKCIAVRTDVPALCSVPADFGLCVNRTARWYFNTEAGKCVPFVYSGCRGNMNNFKTEAECTAICRPSFCPPMVCELECEFGLERDGVGCEVCRCRDPCKDIKCANGAICDKKQGMCVSLKTVPARCKLPSKTGMCRGYFPRWFYNATAGGCERFVYGGCQGNANNFKTNTKCEETCLPSACPDVSHCGWCEHGLAKDERGCTICECSDNPCAIMNCADNMQCEVAKGNCTGPGCQTVARCVPHNETKCPDVMCAMYCEYGLERGPDGCRICRCHNPCKTVNCGAGFMCKVKKCSHDNPECRSVGICVPWRATTTEIPGHRLVKPGMCPQRAQMGAGICAEMCSFDVSCPDMQKCCSNGCGHVCMDPVLKNATTPVPKNAVTTETPEEVSVKSGQCPVATGPGDCVDECSDDVSCPRTQKCCSNGCGHVCMDPVIDVCPVGSIWHNCSGVCEQATCDALQGMSDPTHCWADPCNACRFVVSDESQKEICSGWLCPATNESRPCDKRAMCASSLICEWMPDAKCVDDPCKCQATFVTDFEQVIDCDLELTTCRRMRVRALAKSKVVSDLWIPECDESGYFKPEQMHWGSKWCVDPLGHKLKGSELSHPDDDLGVHCSKATFTSIKGVLWLRADYDKEMDDRAKLVKSLETQLAGAMMVPKLQVDEVQEVTGGEGSIMVSFSVSANGTDLVSLLSKADRFARLVHAGKLRLVHEGQSLPLAQENPDQRFKFDFTYTKEPVEYTSRGGASRGELSRGDVIAITVTASAALLGIMLLGMVCLACRRRKEYRIEEKTSAIPAFENPRYMSTGDMKEKL